MSETGFIYTLIDPRNGEVRYVGATIEPKRRLQSHKSEPPNEDMKMWIDELLDKNNPPLMKLVGFGDVEELAEMEEEIIENMSEEYDLLNRDKGSYSRHRGEWDVEEKTTVQVGTDTRERLAEYRDERDFNNYDEALKSLLQHAKDEK